MYLSYLLILIFIACILIQFKHNIPYFIMLIITILFLLNELYMKTNKKNVS